MLSLSSVLVKPAGDHPVATKGDIGSVWRVRDSGAAIFRPAQLTFSFLESATIARLIAAGGSALPAFEKGIPVLLRFALLAGLASAMPATSRAESAADIVGKTAVMALDADAEAELPQFLQDLGYSAIQTPRDLARGNYAVHRLEILTGGPVSDGLATLLVWKLDKTVDKVRGEWRVAAVLRAKVGSESAFTQDCAGNAKDKPPLTFVFHEGGAVGGPPKQVLGYFRFDRSTARLDRLSGKPPACKVTEEPYEG